MAAPLLALDGLTVHYETRRGALPAVAGVSLELEPGAALGLVGESGSGKTSLAMAILKLLPDNARIVRGEIRFQGRDLVPLPEEQMRGVRWRGISMIFQAAMNAWKPSVCTATADSSVPARSA